jgi:hypothetical protein
MFFPGEILGLPTWIVNKQEEIFLLQGESPSLNQIRQEQGETVQKFKPKLII